MIADCFLILIFRLLIEAWGLLGHVGDNTLNGRPDYPIKRPFIRRISAEIVGFMAR